MNKLIFSGLIILVLAVFLSGCTETSICGDGICSAEESATCPTDCAEPINAKVNVYVSGAYDAAGGASVYWYHGKDVYANASQNITSRLGENWYGQDSQNLYISFNDSKSGEVPLGDDRELSFDFTEQGEYYFEARTKDYSYRAVSSKLTLTDSGEYYVNLNMVPSNPAVRVKALDEYGNQLNGKGKITLVAVESTCEYGECNETEWVYSSTIFGETEEMNALFFVYSPDMYRNNLKYVQKFYYKIFVERDGYEKATQYYSPQYKYQEYYLNLTKQISSETGDLKVSIIPGIGTTQEDLNELEGRGVYACGYYSDCKFATISDGQVYFESLPFDSYFVDSDYSSYDSSSSHPPVSIAGFEVKVDSEIVYAEAKGLRGFGVSIDILDGQGKYIDLVNEEVLETQYCYYENDYNYCYVMDPPSRLSYETNPAEMSMMASSEYQIEKNETTEYSIELTYKGETKWFPLAMKQGYHKYIWQFNGLDYNN